MFVRYHDLLFENRKELLDVATTTRYYAYRTASLLESEQRQGALPGLATTEVHRHPVGTVGIISPWNY